MNRNLNQNFMGDLKTGCLKPLLETVVADHTLDLEIRENYINIYYRGGNLLKVTQKPTNPLSYDFYFNMKYCNTTLAAVFPIPKESQTLPQRYFDFVNNIPLYKQHMDFYLSKKSNKERDVQQQIAYENNMSTIANGTDYFIVDIEYADSENNSRFDMVAVKWPSNNIARQKLDNLSLAFIEVKYGDKALIGTAGILNHMKDIKNFVMNSTLFSCFCNEMQTVMNQKIELGLYGKLSERKAADSSYKIDISRDPKEAELIFILVNHKPASKQLENELANMTKPFTIPVKLAHASHMGYGLYIECMDDL